jgi:hypothetical protein
VLYRGKLLCDCLPKWLQSQQSRLRVVAVDCGDKTPVLEPYAVIDSDSCKADFPSSVQFAIMQSCTRKKETICSSLVLLMADIFFS